MLIHSRKDGIYEAIREGTEVHAELLTLATSCRIYNLLEEALARESSKVLKRRGEGKLVSREQEGKKRLSGEEGKGDNRREGWERQLSEGLQG